jgi:hypothetical protein
MSVVGRSALGHRPRCRKRPRHRGRLATGMAVIALFCIMPPAHAKSITAAGDISNAPGGPRHDMLTADLIRRWNPTAVLALGDVQYEAGELVNFQQAYDRSWGAFKAPSTPAAPWCPMGMRARVGAMGLAEAGPRRAPDPVHAGVLPRSLPCLNGSAWRQPGIGPPLGTAGGGRRRHRAERAQPHLRAVEADADDRGGRCSRCSMDHCGRHRWAVDLPGEPVHPNSVHRVRRYGVYRLIMYPERWIGAFKGVDGKTYDHAGQRCHSRS